MGKLEILHKACCDAMGFDISRDCRRLQFVYARGVYFHYAKKLTDETLDRIGFVSNGRNHATVLHSNRVFTTLLGRRDFDAVHKKCVDAINETEYFKRIILPGQELDKIVVDKSHNDFKEAIDILFGEGVSEGIAKMTPQQIKDLRDYKIKPHLLMLRV